VSTPRNENESCPVNEQTAAWALHALEPDEAAAVLRHLPTCPSCLAVAADAEDVLARMGAAVEQVDPPPSLRDSLMARVAETPQVHHQDAPSEPEPGQAATARAAETPQVHHQDVPSEPEPVRAARPAEPGSHRRGRAGSGPSRPPRASDRPRRGRRLVAAAVALVGVLAIGGLTVRTAQLQQQRDTEIAQTQTVTDLLGQLGRPGTRYALLAGDGGPTVAAVVVVDGERRVYSLGLPANSVDKDTYVLWGLPAAGDPRPLGTFDVAGGAPGARAVGAPGQDAFTKYAISIEPGRAAPATPTKVVAVGNVTA
jgi:anti-sigma-K factor RskA